ncbi:hypothetical protein Tco_0627335 [Tanacetum coccineum]|uniref:Uncharacterized protein n=1 Tax=Tanacetum coccineum TaxID=301880 RepID=A0ABQ4WMB1_9ASTR
MSKTLSPDLSQKLKGFLTLTPQEQQAADTMQALKESKKISKRQPNIRGSSEGTGSIPGAPNESTVVFSPLSERTSTKPGVPGEEKVTSEAKANVTLNWGLEEESEYTKEDYVDENIEWTDDEETDDEFVHSEEYVQDDDEEADDELVHGDEQVNDDEDEETKNAKDTDLGNGDEEITDTAKADAEKTKEAKDDIKKAELPLTSSSLCVSLGFGNQFLNLSFDTSLIVLSPIPKTPSVALAITLLPPPTISSISQVLLQTTPIPTPLTTTKAPPITMLQDPLHAIIQRVYVLENDVQELKEVDNTTTLRASLRSEIPPAVNAYLGSSLGDALQKVLLKHMEKLIQKYPRHVNYKDMIKESVQANIINEVKNQLPKFLPKAVFDFATPVIQSTQQSHPEKVLRKRDHDDENPSAGPNQGKKTKRSRTKESEPSKKSSTSKESSKGKSPTKTSKSGKSVTTEEPVEEPVFEMVSDDFEQIVDDVANDVDEPPDDSTQTKDKDPKKDWFKQPPKPPTPDQE